jgi:hypothetical protein
MFGVPPLPKRLSDYQTLTLTFTISLAKIEIVRIAYAEVAQLVEQLICNQQVAGSNPVFGSS